MMYFVMSFSVAFCHTLVVSVHQLVRLIQAFQYSIFYWRIQSFRWMGAQFAIERKREV